MTPEQMRFKLYGLPIEWQGSVLDDTGLPKPEADRIKSAFSVIRKGVCYVQGNAGPIAEMYVQRGFKVRGVDMSPRISDPFEKEEHKSLPNADVLFLYNIDEGTTGIQLAQKVLKKVLISYKTSMVILCGERTGRAFAKDFLQVSNFCSIPYKKEEKWL